MQIKKKKNEGTQDQDRALGGGGPLRLLDTG